MGPEASLSDAECQLVSKGNLSQVVPTIGAVLISLFLVLGAFHHAEHRWGGLGTMAANFASLGITLTVSVLLHEFGHAVAARALGFNPFLITVGAGPRLFFKEVSGVVTSIGAIPGGGATLFCIPPNRTRLKMRLLLVYAAGPAVSAFLLLIGLYAFPSDWNALVAGSDHWLGPGAALVLLNGFVLLTSAIPSRPLQSDLIKILTLPWMTQQALDDLSQDRSGWKILRLLSLGQEREAFDEASCLLEQDPDDWSVRFTRANILLFARRYEHAAEEFRRVAAAPSLPQSKEQSLLRALILNNYAWSLYVQDKPELLPEADVASKQALELLPYSPPVRGTRGAVLIELGKIAQGRELIRRALRGQPSRINIAIDFALLSIAASREGRQAEARAWLNKSRKRDPEHPILARAERELANASQAA